MKLLSIFVFAIVVVIPAFSIPHHTPDHANHCHVESEKGLLHIEVGESASLPGKCQKVTCEKDFSISALTCPAVGLPANCEESKVDYTKAYPDCCPKITCTEH